jgi:DNA polymerase (family 10)
MNNREMAGTFEAIANLMEIKGEAIYRILAYRRAAEALRGLGRDISKIWEAGELEDIPGVGKAIAGKIDEMIRTDRLEFYEKLASEIPPGLIELLKIDGIGPKKAAQFWSEGGITSIEELEKAAKEGRLSSLSGMGSKSEQKIIDGIQALKSRTTERYLLSSAWDTAQALIGAMGKVKEVERIEAAGSLRRSREMDAFIELPQVERVLGKGDTKASVELVDGMRVQLWVHPSERFGSAWQYATGSQAHNVRLREIALKKGLSLSEHGYKREDGSELLSKDEAEVYAALGLAWIPPELREDQGEIARAQSADFSDLVTLNDLRGELHAHTIWSDGKASIEEMTQSAIGLGMEYLVISDHSRSLGIANGLSIDRLMEQRVKIREVQKKVGKKIRLMHGSEVEIMSDGTLDYPDDVLEQLDIVIASLHTSQKQAKKQVTQRLLNAVRNPHVDIIGHLTGRLINRRDPADLDVEAILKEGAARGVVFEINANAERLDLKDSHAKMALDFGCTLAINTDAHHPDHFDFQRFGIGTARRAAAPAQAILNTWSFKDLEAWLKQR